ncbi:MAG: PAS domain S-box protein [Verrucomicrobia bacterium]|nr:PAS domain S-box protein [Verrucomicrobiota bacterium]MCG2681265.1 PAS domain S-box protein [Kiritimatiellia bacterium]MBU4246933.1 PAS domain S-box protein [Verrucomicrobiota bacterium]MBU4291601.1 PAS domain S-box protein [Verrucomicrobiota bacterium]MBU4428320.1 PAS domain S-box protein [Verrucomicrobiota bacterium]
MKNQEPKTILLVEDDAVTAMIEVIQLKSFGYDVVAATFGKEAVEIATGNDKIDLVLMDINLGSGMDGTEAARQILGKRHLPIVFLTSHSEKEYVERVKAITRYGYIIKNSGDFVIQSSIEMAFELFEANETLRKSEEKFRGFAENLDGIAVRGDMEGKPEFLLGKLEAITGYTWEDFSKKGLNWFDIMHPDDKKELVKQELKNTAAKKPIDLEYRIIRKDGGIRWVCQRIAPHLKEDGTPEFMQGMIIDITERKKVEGVLKASEKMYRTIIETSNDLIWILDIEGKFTYFNRKAEEVSGYILKDWLGKDFAPLIPPEDMERLQHILQEVLNGKTMRYETRVQNKDSTFFVLSINTTPLYSEAGNIIGTISFGQDITERKQAEEKLRENEKKYRQLVEMLQEGVWSIDKDANTTYVNPRLTEMLGYTLEEMLGKPLFNFMDKRGVELIKHYLERRKQGIVEQHDFEFLCKDGSRIVVSLETTPITDEKGDYIGALAGIVDIT